MIADLVGKGGHVRTVPVPTWVKVAVDRWLTAAGVIEGPIFRAINKAQRIGKSGFSPKVIWGVVKAGCSKCGLGNIASHDLRRSCACLCHEDGGELEQIQFLLGHVSVQTTERYLGCKAATPKWSTTKSASNRLRCEDVSATLADFLFPISVTGASREESLRRPHHTHQE